VVVPGWSAFLGRANKTWAGVLEPGEIRGTAIAFAWIVPVVPLLIVALVVGLGLQFSGASTGSSMLPWVAATLYALFALLMWRSHNRKAQLMVARRLGIDTGAAHKIDFRGRARFDRSVAEARAVRRAR